MTDKVINRLKNLKKSKLRKNFKNPFEETGKPDAARGKTTTKGKFKKMTKQLGDVLKMAESNPSLLGSPKGKGMSPGAMGGKTIEDMDLGKMRQRVDAIASSIGTGVGGAIGKKLRNKFNKDEFDDGGVVDMTTEVDVE